MSAFSGRFWLGLSENELQNYQFVIDDPTVWPDIQEALPTGTKLVSIVHKYNFKSHKLKCIHCSKTLHNKGALVLLSNGRFARIGSTCGPKVFPDEWHEAESQFEQARDISETRRRIAELIERVPLAIEHLRRLRPSFKEAERLLGSFARVLGGLDYGKIRTQVDKQDGNLFVERIVEREFAQIFEEAQQQEHGRDKISEPEEKRNTVRLELFHRVSGREFITGASSLNLLTESIDNLESSMRLLKSPKYLEAKKGVRHCNETKHKIYASFTSYEAMFLFFESKNLERISHWFGTEKRKNWDSRGSSLLLYDSKMHVTEVADLGSKDILPWLAVAAIRDKILI